jgi:PAS domain S-box-containing protein
MIRESEHGERILRPERVAVIFALASAAWVLFSDRLAGLLFADSPNALVWASTVKGWFYVAVVAVALWLTLRRINLQFATQRSSLAASEERFRLLVENAGDAIYLCTPGGAIVDVNPEASRQTGHDRQVLVQMQLPELEASEHPATPAALGRIMPPTQRTSLETDHRRQNDERFPVEITLVSLETEGQAFVIGVVRDVSARRRVEEQAKTAKDFLASIINTIPDPVFVKDRTGRFVLVNDALCAMAGCPCQVLLGKRDAAFFPAEQAAAYAAGDALVLQTGRVQVFEETITGPDGKTHDIITKKSLFVDAAGEKRIVGVIQDITERKRIQDAIAREKAFSDAVLDSVPGVFYLYDDSQRLVRWNKHLEFITQYAPEELGQMHLTDWFAGNEEASGLVADALRRMEVEGYASMETQLKTKDNTAPLYYFTAVPLVINGKRYMTGVGLDISARKLAEDELVASRNRINSILDSMPSVVIGLDEDGRVTHWNSFAASLSGTLRSAAMGRPLAQVFPLMAPHAASMETALNERRLTRVERLTVQKNGAATLMEAQFYPLVDNGVSGVVLRIDDVTERERLREMMVQTEKMVSMGGIAAGIAHEINNPLGIVLQATQNLMQRIRPDFGKNIEAAKACGTDMEAIAAYLRARKLDVFLADIHEAALRASATIRHMLDFSRKSESRRKVCDITQIVDKAVELASTDYDLKKSYDFKKIHLVREFDDELPAINCTEIEIEQVVLNLLRNAAQAMATAQPPTAEPRIVIRTRQRPGRLVLEIEDNGPGMPPEVLRRAFEPFFTTKPVGFGTGLGLSVSYFIVTRGHGGTMTAVPGPQGGMTFRIELPAMEQPEAA